MVRSEFPRRKLIVCIWYFYCEVAESVSLLRIRRDGRGVLGQGDSRPSVIKAIGLAQESDETGEDVDPSGQKNMILAISVIIAFVFAVAGIFIGVYFRIERFLKCIDRIGGTSELERPLLDDDTKSIIGDDAMSTLKTQNETGFVHSCPAESYPMKKQIYEKANRTPHVARRSIGPDLPQADPLMIATPMTRRKREGSIAGDTMSLASFKSESGRSIRSMFSARSIGAKSFGSMFSATSKDSKSSSALRNKINMYRKMRQDRKKFKDDDTGSVISEARSQRSMVIDGSSRSVSGSSRHRGKRGSKNEEHSGASAGSNFGNRPQEDDVMSMRSARSTASRASKISRRSTTSVTSRKSTMSLKSLRSKKAKEEPAQTEFLNFGSYVQQEYKDDHQDEPAAGNSDMLF